MKEHTGILQRILPIPQGYTLLKIVDNEITYIKTEDLAKIIGMNELNKITKQRRKRNDKS